MNFFEHQRKSKKNTAYLAFLFILAILSIIFLTNIGIWFVLSLDVDPNTDRLKYDWSYLLYTSMIVPLIVFFAKIFKSFSLSGGGGKICYAMGGLQIDSFTKDLDEKKLFNIVEEMSIASGVPIPEIYILEEKSINAFAAGDNIKNAAVCVTRGAIRCLTRDELQAVIAHEFGHIFNGDMRINIRLISWVYGITFLYLLGRIVLDIFKDSHRSSSRNNKKGVNPILYIGLVLLVMGYVGMLITRIIKSAISRQREFLADASAVQYTRNAPAMSSVLKKILAMSDDQFFSDKSLEEVSHMCFAKSFNSWFSTHPPTEERIKRIDKTFNFDKFEKEEFYDLGLKLDQYYSREISLNDYNARAEVISNLSSEKTIEIKNEKIVGSIGSINLKEVNRANSLLELIPSDIKELSANMFGAKIIIVSYLISVEEEIRDKQFKLLENVELELAKEVYKTFFKIQLISKNARLPLLEIAVSKFKKAPKDSFNNLIELVEKLINIDGKVKIFEMLVYTMLCAISEKKNHKIKKRITSLGKEASVAISFVSLISNNGELEKSKDNFKMSIDILKIKDAKFYSLKELTSSMIAKNLNVLDSLTMRSKEKLVTEYVRIINQDNVISYREQEALALLCSSLTIPMPLLA
ncbi:MAG: M48 family metalloprotease [Halobacteriovoraceae bacterium]|nr:M48 family metalloprotease [Halobacteriovoraceae bacterium]